MVVEGVLVPDGEQVLDGSARGLYDLYQARETEDEREAREDHGAHLPKHLAPCASLRLTFDGSKQSKDSQQFEDAHEPVFVRVLVSHHTCTRKRVHMYYGTCMRKCARSAKCPRTFKSEGCSPLGGIRLRARVRVRRV
jgi:hypothetical protein